MVDIISSYSARTYRKREISKKNKSYKSRLFICYRTQLQNTDVFCFFAVICKGLNKEMHRQQKKMQKVTPSGAA